MLADSESGSDSSTEPGPSKRRKTSKNLGANQLTQRSLLSGGDIFNIIGSVNASNVHLGVGDIKQLNKSNPGSFIQGFNSSEDQLTEVYESLKRDLEQRANEICGEEDRFRGEKIKIAPLQISTKIRDIKLSDRSGHFHRRQDIAEFFHENPCGNISYIKLFQVAKQLAKKKASSKCSTQDAKARYIMSHGNIVFIAGQAGIGKTTFTKLLVQEILNPETHLFNAEFVFYLRFRDINYEEKIDLLQFLTVGGSPSVFKKYKGKTRKVILNKIDDCKNVCVVMDGLDEAKLSKSFVRPINCLDSHEKPEVFIKNIICGHILPKSKKIITSRPRQISQLHTVFIPNLVVNILGLDEKGQEQICHDLFSDDVDRRNQILQYINSRPDLKSYCYVPINCILIMISFYQADFTEWNNVYSLSTILVTALEDWFLTKLEDGTFQTKEISNLAYRGFIKDKYYFEEWDLQKAGVNFQNITTFLTNSIKFELLNGSAVVSYFGHLIWQEFFVATKMRLYMNFEEFKETVSELHSDKFEVVAKFLFGLCNKLTKRKLLERIDNGNLNLSTDRKSCKEMLKKFVIEKLVKIQNDVIQEASDEDSTGDISSVLSESGEDDDGASVLSEQHASGDVSDGDEEVQGAKSRGRMGEVGIFSDEKGSLSKDRGDEWSSDDGDSDSKSGVDEMGESSIAAKDDDIRSAESSDGDSEAKDFVDLHYLDSDDDFMSDEEGSIKDQEGYFSLITPVLTWLHEMRDDEFTKEAASYLNDDLAIDSSDHILPSDISCFIYALRSRTTEMNLQILLPDFAGNCLLYFFQELDSTLRQNPNIRFQELILSEREFGDEGVKYLCFGLANTLEAVDIRNCEITEIGTTVLADSIKKRSNAMKQLTLSGNHVGDKGAAALESCLGLIKTLEAKHCEISPEMQERLEERAVAVGHTVELF